MRRILFPKFIVILLTSLVMFSCDKDDILDHTEWFGFGLPVTGAQEVPAVATSASGTIGATYFTSTKTLSFTVSWFSLSGPVTAMHIHGTAEAGYLAGVLQTFSGFPNTTLYGTVGSYKGTAFMDGVVLKEEDLLAGKYYINIHTATRPAGEIRGQILLKRQAK